MNFRTVYIHALRRQFTTKRNLLMVAAASFVGAFVAIGSCHHQPQEVAGSASTTSSEIPIADAERRTYFLHTFSSSAKAIDAAIGTEIRNTIDSIESVRGNLLDLQLSCHEEACVLFLKFTTEHDAERLTLDALLGPEAALARFVRTAHYVRATPTEPGLLFFERNK